MNCMYHVKSWGFLEEGMEDFLALFGMGGLTSGTAVWEGEHKIAGRVGEGSLCSFAACLASLSAPSLPGIPLCPGIQ